MSSIPHWRNTPQYILNVMRIHIARQRPQYTQATIEDVLQEVFSVWVRAVPIAKQRVSKHIPKDT
jgi:hypothetical protein